MTKAATIGAVERERERESYTSTQCEIYLQNNLKEIKGRNTFINAEIETG